MNGAEEILEHGHAEVNNYGVTSIFEELDQISDGLWKIALDTGSIKKMAVEETHIGNMASLRNKLLDRLEKYMFDGRNAKKRASLTQDLMIVGESGGDEFFEQLKQTHVLPEDAEADDKMLLRDIPKGLTRSEIEARILLENSGDRYGDNMFYKDGRIPDTVVVNISPNNSQLSNEQILALDYMYIDRFRIPKEDRPNIIVYTNG